MTGERPGQYRGIAGQARNDRDDAGRCLAGVTLLDCRAICPGGRATTGRPYEVDTGVGGLLEKYG